MSKNILKKQRIFTGGGSNVSAISTGLLINSSAAKTTPVDADEVPIADSAASFILKKVTWANIKATLKTYFDTLYLSLSGGSMTGSINEAKGVNIASAATTDIGAATGNLVHITGTTTITSFGTVQAGAERTLVFDGALTLTYNATSLILPGAASILTAANDVAVFRSEGSGNWRCISYVKNDEAYTSYVPTLTGNSTDPTLVSARWKMLTRNTCHVIITFSAVGTSNATTKTITLPFNASATSIQHMTASGLDNNTGTLMNVRTRVSSNVADIFRLFSLAHTASGNWTCCMDIVYQID